jgi:hypothetical protein
MIFKHSGQPRHSQEAAGPATTAFPVFETVYRNRISPFMEIYTVFANSKERDLQRSAFPRPAAFAKMSINLNQYTAPFPAVWSQRNVAPHWPPSALQAPRVAAAALKAGPGNRNTRWVLGGC